jgi:hypothetical protein
MHRPHTISTLKAGIAVAGAALVLAASACENVPTSPDDQLAGMAVSAKSDRRVPPARIEICHLTETGEYVKLTFTDATYDLHMAHGDRDLGPNGDCQVAETSRLDVENWGWSNLHPENDIVIVTVLAFGGAPDTQLEDCSGLCSYDIPTGATVSLSGFPESVSIQWDDPSCSTTCVIGQNMKVLVGNFDL